MLIPNKFSGYRRDGIRLYPIDGGGGGGGSAPEKTTQVADLPEWAKPYAQQTLGAAQAVTFAPNGGFQPYQAYTGERTAQFTPLQQQSYQGAQNMGAAPQLNTATNIAGQAGLQALNTGSNYNPYQAQMLTAQAPGLIQYQMGPAQQVQADMFGQQQAANYMSPYIQQALDPQLREASRQSEIQRNQDQARAVASGAFGGSRQAIVEAERQRNLGMRQDDIMARGMQTAYEQSANQFNQDAQRRMQEQQLNQQAGMNVGLQNLNSLLSTQQLGAQTGMQAQLANQQAFQGANQLAEQSRQFGSNLGLQGLQAANQSAGILGTLGSQEFAQEMDANKLQNTYGGQQQQQVQNILNQQYQDFQTQQRYPYQQLEFMSNLIRGTPMGTVNTMYSPQPSLAAQIAGAGTALYGASKLAAKGGVMKADEKKSKKKPAGLAELAITKI